MVVGRRKFSLEACARRRRGVKKYTIAKPPTAQLPGLLTFATAVTLFIAGTVGTRLASADEQAASTPGPVLATPTLNPAEIKKAAIAYLMSTGLSAKQAKRRITRQPDQLTAANRIRRQAPRDIQDIWIDNDGQLVANVLNENGEKIARAAGATPRLVTRTTEDLQTVIDELAEDALHKPPVNFSGASFEINNQTNKILARYMFTKDGGVIPKLAIQHSDTVTATTAIATLALTARVQPGQRMLRRKGNGRRGLCSIGWAVQESGTGMGLSGSPQGLLTSGHCFDINKPAESSVFIIDTLDGSVTEAAGQTYTLGSGGDYGYARLRPGDEALPQVGRAGQEKLVRAIQQNPIVGTTICKDGITTGETCGKVLRTNVTNLVGRDGVNFLIKGQVRADYCAETGDSGGPVYAPFESEVAAPGVAAIGIHSSSITYRINPDAQRVCGEKINPPKPNISDFTPLSDIDPAGNFFVKIAGG